MKPRTVFLMSQGWVCLVHDDEDGLWRSPGGPTILRAKEAEETAMTLMSNGLAYWFGRVPEMTGINQTCAELVRARVAQMVLEEFRGMWQDPEFQRRAVMSMIEVVAASDVLAAAMRAVASGQKLT